jgi:selenium metabolism protein YedF
MTDQTFSNPAAVPSPPLGQIVLAVSSDGMGRGDDELGRLLLRNHLHVLTEVHPKPDVLIFYNGGVKLAAEGSPALEDLRLLVDQGVQVLLCGTCIGHFELQDKVAVGEVSNMYAITETMLQADKVVNL